MWYRKLYSFIKTDVFHVTNLYIKRWFKATLWCHVKAPEIQLNLENRLWKVFAHSLSDVSLLTCLWWVDDHISGTPRWAIHVSDREFSTRGQVSSFENWIKKNILDSNSSGVFFIFLNFKNFLIAVFTLHVGGMSKGTDNGRWVPSNL